MRRLAAIFVALCSTLSAQQPDHAQPPSIDTYISKTWDTLTRATNDCASMRDIKVDEMPFLYLPADQPYPPDVTAMQNRCRVITQTLPRAIYNIADIKPESLPRNGLLYLPKPYVVPGGRFNEMYGWDSFFIIVGLLQSNRDQLAQGMIENFAYEIDHYGALLNANRTYYLTRSQPPLLAEMIRLVLASKNAPNQEWLARAYAAATKDYTLWQMSAHHAGTTGLARYKDFGTGPVPEMADDNEYYRNVIRYMQGHPQAAMQYLIHSERNPDAKEKKRLRELSCDVDATRVCRDAILAGSRLTKAFYDGDRAMRESGFDTSFRFGPYSGSTEQYAPVCLNSLLYKYELDMAGFAATLNKPAEVEIWKHRAEARKAAMQKYLWDGHRFTDYNFVTKKRSTYNYVTEFYPLWAGWATKQQALATQKHLALYERKGGLTMSDHKTGAQWDEPFGWAPAQFFAVAGLADYGFTADAIRLAHKFNTTVETNYSREGTIHEKYDMESASSDVQVTAGYKANAAGFGWTNGVYLYFKALSGSLKP